MHTPDCAILGMGYLGKPLAEKMFENGSRISALKRQSVSANLPVNLHTADLNHPRVFEADFWQTWADKPLWFCLLPPSAVADYPALLAGWLQLARNFGIKHIVYAGSTSVYGDAARPCSEHTAPEPQTESACKIYRVEKLLRESGIPNIDILRLGGLYCAKRHPLHSLLKCSNLTGAHRPVNMLHRNRAVAALHRAAVTPAGLRIRNIVEAQHPTQYNFYRTEAAKLGLPEPAFNLGDQSGGKTVYTVYGDFADLLL
ncbi:MULTISPECIES: SDR family NAD(P)-dependent oxidoreductase [unclassified Neisseria]|uniref:SDR family NAD(P)-dependent oxidoreductase n=1 Tax=unclassified Neisseria TaxID=2623750 RepID=UPI00143050F7|nr:MULTISPECIES: SDR family NAD(P)-dependent oxidoreductase [unclassified Neisseria]MBF0802779.1 SDR family NAD(P)-dependent oxidoreductase [Neisseria sp. 19428wB4_WF04]